MISFSFHLTLARLTHLLGTLAFITYLLHSFIWNGIYVETEPTFGRIHSIQMHFFFSHLLRTNHRFWFLFAQGQQSSHIKICGTNSKSYHSWCQMMKDSCNTGFYIDVKHNGVCQKTHTTVMKKQPNWMDGFYRI